MVLSNYAFIFILIGLLELSIAHYAEVHAPWKIQSREAHSFLTAPTRNKRSDPACNTHEGYCEANKHSCMMHNEQSREHYCGLGHSCTATQACYLSTPCPAHYVLGCTDNQCLSFPCENGGTCQETSSTTYECQCDPGWDPATNCADEIDECSSSPCQNGGTCTDMLNEYVCSCTPGYTEKNCQTDIDECASYPCQNSGTCTDHVNEYSCSCVPGYTGINCQTDYNECGSNPCQNGGTCTDHLNGYSCSCVQGYNGDDCQTDINECASNPCQHNGTCRDQVDGYSCSCDSGYDGLNCQSDINECASNPCQNSGTCADHVNKYSCSCVPGYSGINCQTDINECASDPCQNAGTCTDQVNVYMCTCDLGYAGVNCQTDINECASDPCENGGSCTDNVSRYTCSCVPGYIGSNCETDINECTSIPCQNSGTCTDQLNGYSCSCVPGYSGSNCQTDINECASDPCQNAGTCTDQVNAYMCTCDLGYAGENCQTDVNECASNPCKNGGSCTDNVNRYTCSCVPGYIGSNCQTDMNECTSIPCQNSGTCTDHVNGYSCSCVPGYTGSNCQTDYNECGSNPCQNGGTCTDHLNRYSCSCIPGYNGDNCQTDINECASNPCQNGGSCSDHVNGYSCSCVPGYLGLICQTDINECASSPCQNGGTCIDQVNAFMCSCMLGYAGVICQTDINECASNPCENGGSCTDDVNKYTCSCVPGYLGSNCQTDYDECQSNPCMNTGSCKNLINSYSCDCTGRFEGDVCQTDCRPGPADIVFIVDTSFSLVTNVNRSRDFITEFIKRIPIGPDEFQVGVITYDFETNVLFDLDDYNTTSGMIAELQHIKGEDAATYTLPALQKAKEMITNSSMGARRASSYIILLYDGLSTDRNKAVNEAMLINSIGGRIITAAVGQSISYSELLLISEKQYYTFITSFLDDMLNHILKETVPENCTDCSMVTRSEVILLLDTNKNQTKEDYNQRLTAIRRTIEQVLHYNPNADVGMFSYSDEVEQVFNLSWSSDIDELIAAALQVRVDKLNTTSNLIHALNHIREGNLFKSSRKLIVLFSNAKWNNLDEIDMEVKLLKQQDIHTFGVASGEDCNVDNFASVLNDPSYIFDVKDDGYTSLESLAAITIYYNCTDNIFIKRQCGDNLNDELNRYFISSLDDQCLSFPCHNGATCQDTSTSYNCQCVSGWDPATNCATDYNECSSNPCQNGGSCVDHFNRYSCSFIPGYDGVNCQTDINECASNPCQNGGTCTDQVNAFVCSCMSGYAGVNCQTDINECSSNPCENGGSCTDHVNRYTCSCVQGYIGSNCQTDYDECQPNPCMNTGSCNNLINSFSCDCTGRYEGDVCQTDCRPGPADIVFIFDTSSSLVTNVNKSLDFITELINRILIGPDDFQVCVITHDFETNVFFDLDDHNTASGMIAELQHIKGEDATTYTLPALQKAKEMITYSSMGARRTSSYIILLYDGLSTDRNNAVNEAMLISSIGGRIITAAVGQSISYSELLLISEKLYFTFSTSFFG
ncbi:uncharacterized protein LOC127733658 [Mytilus californianus]|uniref:uncharacterized protein LOC127733658 n=1 Tax=Mytilus californianus TaxID=6549 RepID=UPI0022471512|nr:uncharacterized protein LOC127733658 [Mytilus californianus]